jgi:hypothetical protein
MNKEYKIILCGVAGSQAYGLDTPDSDIDLKGVFVHKTIDLLGIDKQKETINHTNPDSCYHEVAKFIRLALKCNPTILEQLYLNEYTQLTEEGRLLIDNRDLFLSNSVYKSYGGYAISQARKLNRRGTSFDVGMKNRYAKHARHCYRLLDQGKQLLETGTLEIRVKNREELFEIGNLPPEKLVERFEKEFKEFDRIKSILPEKPNFEKINEILLTIRRSNYDSQEI